MATCLFRSPRTIIIPELLLVILQSEARIREKGHNDNLSAAYGAFCSGNRKNNNTSGLILKW